MSLVSTLRYTRRDVFDRELRTGGIDVLRIPEIAMSQYNDPIELMEKVNKEVIPAIKRIGDHENMRKLLLLFPRIMPHSRGGRRVQPFRVRTANETQLEYRIMDERNTVDPLSPTDYVVTGGALRQYCFFLGIGKSSQITMMIKEGRLNSFLRDGIDTRRGLEEQKDFRVYLLSEVNRINL